MKDVWAKLDERFARGDLKGFTLWKTPNRGYQANLQSADTGAWRVRTADTPSEAIALVLDMDFVDEIDRAAGLAAPVIDEAGVFD